MTKDKLSQLYWIKREIEHDTALLMRIENSATGSYPPDGLPFGVKYSEKDLKNIRAKIEQNKAKCIKELEILLTYILNIPNSYMRQIFTLRYINALSWEEVSRMLGGASADSVRMAHDRFLKSQENKN